MGSRLPKMTDVACRAGVSHQTVSRVVNEHPNVAGATRQRVLAAITELGYRRNSQARALVTRRTQTIGVVTRDTTLYGPASTLLAIELAARSADYGSRSRALAFATGTPSRWRSASLSPPVSTGWLWWRSGMPCPPQSKSP